MGRLVRIACALVLGALVFMVPFGAGRPVNAYVPHAMAMRSGADTASRLPLAFQVNQGQTNRQVKFLLDGPGYSVFLAPGQAVMSLALSPLQPPLTRSIQQAYRSNSLLTPGIHSDANRRAVVRFRFLRANRHAAVVGLDPLPGRVNYITGNNPRSWHTNIRTYGRVEYRDIYPGIDLLYSSRDGHLVADWLLHPHANAAAIQVLETGPGRLGIDRRGDVSLRIGKNSLVQASPHVYEKSSRRTVISARYRLRDSILHVVVGAYNHAHVLVIDPAIEYASVFGGSNADQSLGIAVDTAGDTYITGGAFSTDFPTTHPYQSENNGDLNAFVTKLDPTGTVMLYSTYLGGDAADEGYAIAVDAQGDAYVTGDTTSDDFPTVSPIKATNPPICIGPHEEPIPCADAFVTKLNAAGNTPLYSTYLGGTGDDRGYGIALDNAGEAFITGVTDSADFPAVNAVQPATSGTACTDARGHDVACTDAFVAKLDASGTGLVYSTYLGGSDLEEGDAIAIDGAGSAYVVGLTNSTDFPTVHPYQAASAGAPDAFVTKYSPDGRSMVYSTYLGGSDDDQAMGVAVDAAGSAYVTGFTFSTDFPVKNALKTANSGGDDAFVTKLAPDGGSLDYSTYVGGTGNDTASAIVVDPLGSAYIAGDTGSSDYPAVDAPQTSLKGETDAFVTALTPAGTGILYSTYLGGSDVDNASALALDGAGNLYVTGGTLSTDFPTTTALRPAGTGGVFVVRLSSIVPTPTPAPTSTPTPTATPHPHPAVRPVAPHHRVRHHGRVRCKKGYRAVHGHCRKRKKKGRPSSAVSMARFVPAA